VKRGLALFAATALWWSAIATAGGHKVLVLPIDGDADPALRKQLTSLVVSLARSEGGDVTTGDTTFAETAAAIGCDPHAPACSEQVRAGLNVDEIVFGSAFSGGGQTTAVISKAEKGQPRRDQTLSIGAHQKADSAEATLLPMFGGPAQEPKPEAGSASGSGSASEPGSGSGSGSGSDIATGSGAGSTVVANAEPHSTFLSTRDSQLGFGLVAGGGLAFLLGLALWSSESGLQDQINSAPNNTSAQIASLRDLEDRASTKAWEGNFLVFAGLAAAGIGTYYLIKDHEVHATVTPIGPVTPGDHAAGAAVVLGGRW
jgi:hypothetical protein